MQIYSNCQKNSLIGVLLNKKSGEKKVLFTNLISQNAEKILRKPNH